MLDSLDTREKVTHVISSLDIWDILYFADSDEGIIALIVFRLGLDIGIIPETYHIVLITELEYRHRDIRTTTDMDQYLWFCYQLRSIDSVLEDICGYLLRESWNLEFWIFFEERTE